MAYLCPRSTPRSRPRRTDYASKLVYLQLLRDENDLGFNRAGRA